MKNTFISTHDMLSIPANEISSSCLNTSPKLSVIMLVYNHEKYISQAIQSIVDQVNFSDIELLIGEDFSIDKTRNICIDFQKKYPRSIRVITYDQNVGARKNFLRLWSRTKANYIAFCEGDDFWIDTEKALKQFQFMEENKNYSLCATYTQTIEEDEKGIQLNGAIIKPKIEHPSYKFSNLIADYSFHTSSVLIRKSSVNFPLWFWDVYCVDRPLYLLATQQGTARLIPEITSVYRHHTGGSWSPLSWQDKADKSIFLFKTMANHFEPRYKKMFYQTLGGILWFYMSESLNKQEIYLSKKLFFKSLAYNKFNLKYPSIADIIQVLIRLVKLEIVNYAKENTSNNDRVTTNK